MITFKPCDFRRFNFILFCAICTLAALFSGRLATATDVLAYSYETIPGPGPGPDGVETNAGGVYTQDTIGATEGTHSMKVSLVANGDTFVGAVTPLINPTPTGAVIGDPPGIDHVTFDVTITEEFTGNFSNMGVIVFGCDQANVCGLKRQYIDEENIDLPVGTHTDLRIDLLLSYESVDSFNDTFGEPGSGSDLYPTAFQFYFNKSFNAAQTLFIDNVRVGMTTPGVPGDYNGNGAVDAADYALWRKGGPLQNEVDTPGTVNAADYTEWRARFGNTSGSGIGSLSTAVPEPTSMMLLLVVSAAHVLGVRKRSLMRWRRFVMAVL
jgi:hypothetical protein